MKTIIKIVQSSESKVDSKEKHLNRMKYIVCLLFLAFICQLSTVNCLFAADNGTSGGMILRLNPSAQAAGMAEAMTSIGENLNSIDFNPAGISHMSGYTAYKFSFSHVEYLEEIKYEDLKFATYLKSLKGFVGVNMKFLNMTDIRRDVWGNSSGEFKNNNYVLGVSFARALKDADFGFQLKYISEKLADEKSVGAVAADAGFLYSTYVIPFDIGMSLRNVGTAIGYGSYKDPLPLEARFGISRDFDAVLFSADAVKQREGQFVGNIGAEVKVMGDFKLRAGYTSQNRYSAGFGFVTNALSLDYAFSPFSNLSGDVHRVSFEVKFGRTGAPRIQKPKPVKAGNALEKQMEKLKEEKTKKEESQKIEVKEDKSAPAVQEEITVKEEPAGQGSNGIKAAPGQSDIKVNEEKPSKKAPPITILQKIIEEQQIKEEGQKIEDPQFRVIEEK